ncbi:efflux RND transporter periplasmic adaptor subunit [Haloimpatiens sp. FM7330]|uniref:efflux RND transporter periplasmic adaptor subunit n=1 Tax=Haloimpatiens sp. FM7330 TaxID=3298610 RepID=UPI00362DF190
MKKKIWFLVISVIVIASLIGIRLINKNKKMYSQVKTTIVNEGGLKAYLSTNGKIESQSSKDYYGVQGKVSKINVKEGQSVKKGDVLINYDVPDLNAAVKQAELQYNNSVLQKDDLLDQKKSVDNKISKLNSEISKLEKSNNPQELAKVETLKQQRDAIPTISEEKIKQAKNGVELAKISLDNAKNNLAKSKSRLICENDGVVTAINVKEGAVDNGMQPALVVKDIQNLKMKISLGKYDISKIKLNQQAIVKSHNKQYKAKVSFIDPAAKEEMSSTGKETFLGIEVKLLEKSDDLKIGFDADVDILVGERKNTLKIPAEAIKVDKKGNNYIYVVKDNKAEERKVSLGLQSDMEVEILKGLKKGEKVILNPSASIKNGTLVKEYTEEN